MKFLGFIYKPLQTYSSEFEGLRLLEYQSVPILQKFGRADVLQSRDSEAQRTHKIKKTENIKNYLTPTTSDPEIHSMELVKAHK